MVECDKIRTGYVMVLEVFIYNYVPYRRADLMGDVASETPYKSSHNVATMMMKQMNRVNLWRSRCTDFLEFRMPGKV